MRYDFQRQYELNLFLGDPQGPPFWTADVWRSIAAAVDPLVKSKRGTPAVTSLQYSPPPKGKPLRFGKIGWAQDGHSKWTHTADTDAVFVETKVWSPGPTACEEQGLPPDFFLSLYNMGALGRSGNFRDVLLLAAAVDQPPLTERAVAPRKNSAPSCAASYVPAASALGAGPSRTPTASPTASRTCPDAASSSLASRPKPTPAKISSSKTGIFGNRAAYSRYNPANQPASQRVSTSDG